MFSKPIDSSSYKSNKLTSTKIFLPVCLIKAAISLALIFLLHTIAKSLVIVGYLETGVYLIASSLNCNNKSKLS